MKCKVINVNVPIRDYRFIILPLGSSINEIMEFRTILDTRASAPSLLHHAFYYNTFTLTRDYLFFIIFITTLQFSVHLKFKQLHYEVLFATGSGVRRMQISWVGKKIPINIFIHNI